MNFQEILEKNSEFKNYIQSLSSTPISVSGIVESALAHFITASVKDKTALVVMYSDDEAKNLYYDLKFFCDNALFFPTREYTYYNIEALGHFNEQRRINILNHIIASDSSYIVVTSLEALLGYTIPPDVLSDNTIELKQGDIFDTGRLAKLLVNMGYTHSDTVEGCGQFSVRGGILDVFSPSNDFPYRIEFFDDEVDSIRIYDYVSQRSMDIASNAVILPCREAIYSDEKRLEITDILSKKLKKLKNKKTDMTELISTVQSDIEAISEKRDFAAIDKYASLIYDRIYTLLDYFCDKDMIFVHEPKRLAERAKSLSWEQGEQINELTQKGLLLTDGIDFSLDFNEFCSRAGKMCHVSVNSLNHTSISYKYKALFDFNSRATVSLHGKIDYLISDLEAWQKNKTTVIILASNRGRGENISGILNDKGIKTTFLNDKKEFKEGEISVICGELKKGFEYPDLNFVLISEQEIFNTEKKRQQRKIENTKRLKSYNDISPGDYVVHQAHGIGKYTGLKKITVSGVTRDYLQIQYQGNDALYIPVDQMDMLYKYTGDPDKEIKLNKLNNSDWTKSKAKVKKSTDNIARQLAALYAERSKAKGFAFPPDGPWQRDFEDSFPYEETDDQLRSIEEVKRDMESERPMDRLLCGDVGYGKTEVAIRAAFKAAVNSKQVAYLCPTTVLAMQHYNTFCKRMDDFAIKTEMLSRFRTPAQQKKIIKDLKTGAIDIVIGTHKLLQKDVEFKDLGLLIIDEEQRFGVTHKEKLKELKKNIDVLSMTATPIPRTLHMSMINIRDMSLLETPPENRYPVQTYVLEYNESILADAMKRELSRGGQVFYLHNRVDSIYNTANRIAELIPNATVAVGHGKMNETELEDIMYDMVNGKTDILVCTTIIETGLDIPNANTIIIENADRMGLSQLYQLRGRVGRSNRSAYAYFTYKADSVLSDVAQKRLKAIKEFTEFGSGFKVAMRDLEIRGAGSLLGAKQHGHMDAVGYDLYCKILQQSIDELQGAETKKEITTTVDFDYDAYIPEQYIENLNQRIDIYKKIAAVSSEDELSEITDELIDRYGEPPIAVTNLISISLIKHLANSVGITDVSAKRTTVIFKFSHEEADPEIFVGLLKEFQGKITLSSSNIPTIIYKNTEPSKLFENIKFLLHTVIRLKNGEK
ncbi:MAG: transcription-repair coupling factor [Clostridia bacterium]|nr:transcription-repair coupling factor [Clostridia bacterium]